MDDVGSAGVSRNDADNLAWQIWVSEPLNKEAEVLIKWSRTSFFGGCPTMEPWVVDGREYTLFQKCNNEWTVKYALSTALPHYRFVKLLRQGTEVSTEPFTKDLPRKDGNILGDAATMGRSGGMC